MNRRLGIALSLSVLLIGGATWIRVTRAHASFGDLTIVNSATAEISSTPEASLIPLSEASSTSFEDGLNTTDLIGRQYVTDYLGLAANGQATDANISTMADNLAQNLTTLFTYNPIDSSSLNQVSDTKASFQAYSDAVSAIYAKYHDLTGALLKNNDLSDISSASFQDTLHTIAGYYASAAKGLEAVPVPQSLADLHLKLINNYLSTASAFSAVGNVQNDAATAYSALNAAGANSADESDTLLQIRSVLAGNGIFSFSIEQ